MKQQLEDLAFATRTRSGTPRSTTWCRRARPSASCTSRRCSKTCVGGWPSSVSTPKSPGARSTCVSIYEKMVVKGKEFTDIFDLVGNTGDRGNGEGLLRRAGLDPRHVEAGAGAVQGLHRHAQVQPLPVVATRRWWAPVARRSRCRSVPVRCISAGGVRRGRALRLQGRRLGVRHAVAQPHHRLAAGDSDPGAFMETLKVDLDQDEVYVFTPKGRVMTLPNGATPIDFAYSIHTEVGHACIGARLNGRLVPLDSKLVSGDTVEIFTSKVEGAGPSRDWLQIVATPRAANKIRQWFSRERREDAIDNGREELIKALRREGLPVQKIAASNLLPEVATSLNYAEPRRAARVDRREPRVGQVGRGHASPRNCATANPRREEQLPTTVRQRVRAASARRSASTSRARRRDGAIVALLHTCARRRDHGLRHTRPRRVGAPFRLRQRRVAGGRQGRTAHRGRMGHRQSPACSWRRSR